VALPLQAVVKVVKKVAVAVSTVLI